MAFTRATAALIGTPASPATVNTSNGTQQGVYDLTSPAGQVEAAFACRLTAGSTAPTAAIVVLWEASLDGTNYYADQTQSITLTNSASIDVSYIAPDAVQKVRCTVTNPDTTRTITCYCQGASLVSA